MLWGFCKGMASETEYVIYLHEFLCQDQTSKKITYLFLRVFSVFTSALKTETKLINFIYIWTPFSKISLLNPFPFNHSDGEKF